MARQYLCKAALATLLGFGLAGFANAQSAYAPPRFAPPPATSGYASPAQPIVIPVANQQPCPTTGEVVTEGEAAPEGRGHTLFDKIVNHERLGCWAHHNAFGCTSFPSEMEFIFGSCRSFFGQACLKQPPPDQGAPFRDGTPDAANPRARAPFSFCPNCH